MVFSSLQVWIVVSVIVMILVCVIWCLFVREMDVDVSIFDCALMNIEPVKLRCTNSYSNVYVEE